MEVTVVFGRPGAAFKNAQDLANDGKLVIVAWKNPHPTDTDSGHVAVVVPPRQEDGGLFDATKLKWKMKVPFIAQAGEKVSDYMPLSVRLRTSEEGGDGDLRAVTVNHERHGLRVRPEITIQASDLRRLP